MSKVKLAVTREEAVKIIKKAILKKEVEQKHLQKEFVKTHFQNPEEKPTELDIENNSLTKENVKIK